MTHVFALMLYVGGNLIEPPMHFHKIEACLYYAREAVRRYGTLQTQEHFGLAYCIPKMVNPEETVVY
jgi:hypothetical protein|tara:strand:- start:227 stop:427 length:201 start_codon:yes stop_codon:yes gene_type:complete